MRVKDTWGRRWGMFVGAVIIILGTCIQAPSNTLAVFKAGRFVLGFGVALSASTPPLCWPLNWFVRPDN